MEAGDYAISFWQKKNQIVSGGTALAEDVRMDRCPAGEATSASPQEVLSVADRVNTISVTFAAAAGLSITSEHRRVAAATAWPRIHITPAATDTLSPGHTDTPVVAATHIIHIRMDAALGESTLNLARTAVRGRSFPGIQTMSAAGLGLTIKMVKVVVVLERVTWPQWAGSVATGDRLIK